MPSLRETPILHAITVEKSLHLFLCDRYLFLSIKETEGFLVPFESAMVMVFSDADVTQKDGPIPLGFTIS